MRPLKIISLLLCLLTSITGLLFIYGWHAHQIILIQMHPQYIATVYNVGLCLSFLGVVGICSLFQRFFYLSMLMLAAVSTICLMTLYQHLTGSNLHIDQLFFQHYININTAFPGRMAPNTSLLLLLGSIATGFLFLKWPSRSYTFLSLFLGLLIFSMAAIFLSGYLTHTYGVYRWGNLIPIGPNTAIGLLILGTSIISLAFLSALNEKIDLLRKLPLILFICLFAGTLLYWQAFYLNSYQIPEKAVPFLTLLLGSFIAFLLAMTLRYALVAKRKTKAALAEAETNKKLLSLVNATLEATSDGILVTNTKGNIVSYNKHFLRMFSFVDDNTFHGKTDALIEALLKKLRFPEKIQKRILALQDNPEMEANDELELLNGNAYECQSKPQRVNDKVIGRVYSFHDITDHRSMENELRRKATHDALTNLPNRTLLHERLLHILDESKNKQTVFAVLFCNLDRFKFLNNSYTHQLGDLLLNEIANRLKKMTAPNDTVSRFGGDEFVIVLTGFKNESDYQPLLEAYLAAFQKTYVLEPYRFNLTASIGVAFYPKNGENPFELIKNADSAVYSAKKRGGNCYEFYAKEDTDRFTERMHLEEDLRNAILLNQFFLHYQPLVDLQTQKIIGAEALLRWNHPTRGLVSPDKFISIAEEIDLIHEMGTWVLKTACQQNKDWQDKGLPPLCIAVNIAGKQFRQTELHTIIAEILNQTGLSPDYLEIELTESSLIEDSEDSRIKLEALRKIGLHLSIDDFGTGYSSLSYLKQFPLDTLKIDQSFVRGLEQNKSNEAIIKAIIHMAHSLQFKVIAEGIETEAHYQFLREQACNYGQGYYFSKPLSAEMFEALLKKGIHSP